VSVAAALFRRLSWLTPLGLALPRPSVDRSGRQAPFGERLERGEVSADLAAVEIRAAVQAAGEDRAPVRAEGERR
jgi:hypothetical protein